MKILITGGCGFLGSNLALYGIENGCKITIFDNLSRIGSKFYLWRYTRKKAYKKLYKMKNLTLYFI